MGKKTNKVLDMKGSLEAMAEKLKSLEATDQDIAKVVIGCLVSHRTVVRYLNGEVSNLNLAIKMYDILSKSIDERNSLSVA